MNQFHPTQLEFEKRYYRWAKRDLARELAEGFPSLDGVSSMGAVVLKDYANVLPAAQLKILASGLLKRFHPMACEAIGEQISPAEQLLLEKYQQACRDQSNLEALRPPIKVADRRRTREAVVGAFLEKYRGSCVNVEGSLQDMGIEAEFEMPLGDWRHCTIFSFGRREPELSYWHDIVSVKTLPPFDPPALSLVRFASPCQWFGLGHTEWQIGVRELHRTASKIVHLCSHFFSAAPHLVSGLRGP